MVYADEKMCQELLALGYDGEWHKCLVWVEGGSFHPVEDHDFRKLGARAFPMPCMEELVEWLEERRGFTVDAHPAGAASGGRRWHVEVSGGGYRASGFSDAATRSGACMDAARLCIARMLDVENITVGYIDAKTEI